MAGPKHPSAQTFVARGFFRDVESFGQLEERVSALPSNADRGNAFEVFDEAYLVTQRSVQAKDVWPFEVIPRRLRTKHALDTARDMGVDGVYESILGALNAYQVKFRSNRPKLRWEDLSTFMGLTEQVDQRVLFTNSDELPSLMNDRSDFFCIRGADLDRLEPSDFGDIASWLESGAFTHVRKTPRNYQQEAVDAIGSRLEAEDRTTAILACGTGKTLIGLWVAEDVATRNVLVLEPSLALIRQTLHEWVKETSWDDCGFLCVCSDPSVAKGQDEVILQQSDLDFPVTTDPERVAKFLRSRKIGKRIVFSTYQSAVVLAEALPKTFRFDIGLFDEAHKTAGRENTQFSFVLSDDNLRIRKRVFLTATPRHYDIRKKDKEGDAKLVYSMDAPESYGSRGYTLSFREAADRDIICDYKVLISVVTDEIVNDELLGRGEVVVEGDVVKARQVANQVALQKAVEQFDVGRIFTFHRSVASAKSFVAPGGEGIGAHLPEFATYHVNGTMRTAKRDELIQAFRETEQGIMTNARCLTEGVDVPAVDMVAFMSPKKSKVDIVQAVGRAMRKAPDKEVGFVLVPLYLEQGEGETVEDALEQTDFSEVWNVLQAMQEQDEELADIIRQMREERGRTKGYDDSRFRERLYVLGPEISLGALRESITTACIDRLGVTWDERYGELLAYKERHEDCDVPARWKDNPGLAAWVDHQRGQWKRNQLAKRRIEALESVGFIWDAHRARWEEMYRQLADFVRSEGHCLVPYGWEKNSELGRWVTKQRTRYDNGKLLDTDVWRLEKLHSEVLLGESLLAHLDRLHQWNEARRLVCASEQAEESRTCWRDSQRSQIRSCPW